MESNGSWKNLQLSFNDFSDKIKEYVSTNKLMSYNYRALETTRVSKKYEVKLQIPNQETCLIHCWETKSGLTISTNQGKNKELGKNICATLLSDTQQTETSSCAFTNINDYTYNKILQIINSKYTVSTFNSTKTSIQSKVSYKTFSFTITYYPNTNTLFLQGKSTTLWKDAILDINGEINIDPQKIIEIYLDKVEKLELTKIKCDVGVLKKLSISLVGDEAYMNTRILDEIEKKWLHTSVFFHYTEIELEDYCHAVAASIKIIEGILKRIFSANSISITNGFDQFELVNGSSKHTLKKEFHCYFDSKAIKHISDLYEFISRIRNDIFHDEGAGNKTMQKDKSISIFDNIVTLIKSTHAITNSLFKKTI